MLSPKFHVMQLTIIAAIFFCFTWLICATTTQAQTSSEWWQQNKTRLEYLEQQMAALEAFRNTVEKGYAIEEEGLDTIETIKEEDYNLHYTFFKSQGIIHPVLKNSPEVSGIIALHLHVIMEMARTIADWCLSPWLSAQELSTIQGRYDLLRKICSEDLGRLEALTEEGLLNMSDGERLEAITAIGHSVDETLSFVLRNKDKTNRLIEERRRASGDIDNLKNMFP